MRHTQGAGDGSDSQEIFWRLVRHTNGKVRREKGDNPQCDIDCPDCGRGRKHFGFSLKGANCFGCGYKTSLQGLAARLGLDQSTPYQAREYEQQEQPELPAYWQKNPQKYLDRFTSHPDVYARWSQYKPLSMNTIARHKLGVGVLPSSQCKHTRLIVPILFDGRILGFRGRALTCACTKDCPKDCKRHCPRWLSALNTKTTLYGVEDIQPGDKVFWVENHVDALLVHELMPEFKGVASTSGAGAWKNLIPLLAARKPGLVVVALDNDLVGNPNSQTYVKLAREFREKNGRAPHKPNGYQIMAALCQSRVRCTMWQWPDGTPAKYDMGSFLMEGV